MCGFPSPARVLSAGYCHWHTSRISGPAPLYACRSARMLSESWRTALIWFHISRSPSVGWASEQKGHKQTRRACVYKQLGRGQHAVWLVRQSSFIPAGLVFTLQYNKPPGKGPLTPAHYSVQNTHPSFCTQETTHVGIIMGSPLLVEHTFCTPTMCQAVHQVLEGVNIVFLRPLLIGEAIEYFPLWLKIGESEYRWEKNHPLHIST